MYRAFIVDDEDAVRDGLKNYFNWSQYGVEIVGDADDGDVAFEKILELKPDILISDVKMPNMDGTVLTEKLIGAGMNLQVLFISGYSEVQLVKSALRFKAEDYILKPINLAELEGAVCRITKKLNDNQSKIEELHKMEALLYKSMPLLHEKYLLSMISGGVTDYEGIRKDIDFLGLEISDGLPIAVFVLTIDEYGGIYDPQVEKEKYLCSFAVTNIVTELINRELKGYICREEKSRFLGLIQWKGLNEEALKELCEKIRASIYEALQVSVSIGTGSIEESILNVNRSYQVALAVINNKFVYGSGVYVTSDYRQQKNADMNILYQYLNNMVLDLGAYRDKAEIEAFIDGVFEKIIAMKYVNEEDIKNLCFHIVYKLNSILAVQDLADAGDSKKQNEAVNKIFRQNNVEGLKNCVVQYFDEVVCKYRKGGDELYYSGVSQIKKLLNDDYAHQWTLDELSARVNISKAYLCTLFKQSTGQTIMDYLSKVRVYSAAAMLRDPRNKVNEVGDKVGYGDPGYFTRIFKKYFGVSPSRYRKNL